MRRRSFLGWCLAALSGASAPVRAAARPPVREGREVWTCPDDGLRFVVLHLLLPEGQSVRDYGGWVSENVQTPEGYREVSREVNPGKGGRSLYVRVVQERVL